jgi:hypothetical protein
LELAEVFERVTRVPRAAHGGPRDRGDDQVIALRRREGDVASVATTPLASKWILA